MSDLLIWWQQLPAHISPVALQLGPLPIRWYGLMYLVAFLVSFLLVVYRIRRGEAEFISAENKKAEATLSDVYFYGILGLLIGARVGYMFFYNFGEFLSNPLALVWPFQDGKFAGLAGMSFHGGVIGVAVAFIICAQLKKINLFKLSDLILPTIPLGYFFGRLGNWLNGELWGRITTWSGGQVFPAAGSELRHASQLYEAFLEGLILFLVIWPLRNRLAKIGAGVASGLFLIGYALARITVEFFREPDAHLGFIFGPLTMGQLLSLAMIVAGGGVIANALYKRRHLS